MPGLERCTRVAVPAQLVAAASSVAIVAMAVSAAAVAVPAASRFLAGIIAALLRCGPAFSLAHLLWTVLLPVLRPVLLPILAAVKGALLVVAVNGLPVHALHGGPVLPALPVRLRGALLAE